MNQTESKNSKMSSIGHQENETSNNSWQVVDSSGSHQSQNNQQMSGTNSTAGLKLDSKKVTEYIVEPDNGMGGP